MSKQYAAPQVYTLGTVTELTARTDKCGGSGDAFASQIPGVTLSNNVSLTGHCEDPNQVIIVP
jgi:hypothetical protein